MSFGTAVWSKVLISGEVLRRVLVGGKSRGTHTAEVCATLALVPLKGIRPSGVVLSQDTAENFFCDRGIIRELESNFVIEFPSVASGRVESQRNAAVGDFCLRWVALDLQGDGVGRMLVPKAFIAFGFANFLPISVLDVNIQFGVLFLFVCGRVELRFHGSEGWLLSERG